MDEDVATEMPTTNTEDPVELQNKSVTEAASKTFKTVSNCNQCNKLLIH